MTCLSNLASGRTLPSVPITVCNAALAPSAR